MVRVIDKEVLSSDKKHMLKGKVYLPEGVAKGLFQVVHGMTEYIGRYDAFMRKMAESGYITFGYDHIGHGQTASKEELGYFAEKDSWRLLVDDVFLFAKEVKNEMGKALSLILMGHSMGSFIVRLTAAKYDHCDKLIIMGTGGPNPAAAPGMLLLRAEILRNGERGYSDFIEKMMFGQYNKGFQEDDMLAWLSTLQETRDLYRDDPKCGFRFTLSADMDLVTLLRLCNRKSWFTRANMNMPILLVSGSEDPVGDHGKGVEKVYKGLKAAGKDVRMKLYQGYRHEILNDACRDEVIADILAFAQEGL